MEDRRRPSRCVSLSLAVEPDHSDDSIVLSRPALPTHPARPYVHLTLSHHVEELEAAKPAPTEFDLGHAVSHVDRSIETYIERCRQRIPSFVGANFSLEQTWRLQRPTLWLDLACAPINAAWALPHLAIHKAAEATERVGYPRLAQWTMCLPPGIKTGYQRQIERRICRDLLEWDREESRAALPQGLLKELEAVPLLRKRIETLDFERSDRAPARTLADLLRQFSSGRAIVSDLFGTLLTLATSWALMGSTSLSLTNIAHGVARKSAHDRAASRFFLGKKAGSAFYNVFPPAVHESTIWTTLVVLAAGLTVGAMACTILSDPIRKLLGFHRHRLDVLLDDMERELIVLSHKRIRQELRGPDVGFRVMPPPGREPGTSGS